MGREIKRVPLDFDWPMNKVWSGFQNPHYEGHCKQCSQCGGSGLSAPAKALQDKWYGYVPFLPAETNSEPFKPDHPHIVARAQRNVEQSPEYYGSGAAAVDREARRLCDHYNSHWMYHLDQRDVAALMKSGRLSELTNSLGRTPTPREVNEWAIGWFLGHDSINRWIVVKAKAKRLGYPTECSICKGRGHVWDSPANKRRAERWKSSEPPSGEGWQMWETVSEGSPVTPVFETPEALVDYLVAVNGYDRGAAEKFIGVGWVPSGMICGGTFKSNLDVLV